MVNTMKKELWLFTMRFPFGNSEAFLENELPVLCERYDRVLLIPGQYDGAKRSLPPNVEVLLLLEDPHRTVSAVEIARDPRSAISLMFSLLKDAPNLSLLHKQCAAELHNCSIGPSE